MIKMATLSKLRQSNYLCHAIRKGSKSVIVGGIIYDAATELPACDMTEEEREANDWRILK